MRIPNLRRSVEAVVLPIALHSGLRSILLCDNLPLDCLLVLHIKMSRGPASFTVGTSRTPEAPSGIHRSPEFNPTKAAELVAASEAGLVPVASAIYLLKRDVVWCRFSPGDFAKLHDYARRLVVRASGMCAYFGVIDPTRERFPTTPAPLFPETPPPPQPWTISTCLSSTNPRKRTRPKHLTHLLSRR
jgi:hypothetical protein